MGREGRAEQAPSGSQINSSSPGVDREISLIARERPPHQGVNCFSDTKSLATNARGDGAQIDDQSG